ncbi:DUF4235 domain-containing protein [Jonesia denitrificans]|nr:DUF4235 domain-containing protein [Jonesia denitrificans]
MGGCDVPRWLVVCVVVGEEDVMAKDQSTTEKLVTMGLSLAAGWVAHKIVEKVWDKATGGLSHDLDDDDAQVASVITFAAVSAVVASLTQVMARKSSHKVVARLSPKK